MPGSRLPGLPAQFLGSGDGHGCVPFRSLNERRFLIDILRQSSPASTSFVLASGCGRSTLTPVPHWRAPRPRKLSGAGLTAGRNGVPFGDAILTTKALSEMPFGYTPDPPLAAHNERPECHRLIRLGSGSGSTKPGPGRRRSARGLTQMAFVGGR